MAVKRKRQEESVVAVIAGLHRPTKRRKVTVPPLTPPPPPIPPPTPPTVVPPPPSPPLVPPPTPPLAVKQPKISLTYQQKNFLRKYTHDSSINELLRNESVKEGSKTIVNMIQALDKLPNFDGIVYRRTNLPPSVLHDLQTSRTFSDKWFFSTSRLNFAKMYKWQDCQCSMTIVSRTGKDSSQFATKSYKDEAEVLFRPNTQFHVTSFESRLHRSYSGKYRVKFWIEMEEIVTH